jgi:serine/threonine protein kinase
MHASIGHAPEILSVKRPSEEGFKVRKISKQKLTLEKTREEEPRVYRNQRGVWLVEFKGVEGTNIDDYLNHKITSKQLKEVADQLGSIAGFIHKHGFAHGDMHECNFIVAHERGKPRVYLFDNETVSLWGEKWGFSKLDQFGSEIQVSDRPPADNIRRDIDRVLTVSDSFDTFRIAPHASFRDSTDRKVGGKTFPQMINEAYEREVTSPAMMFRGKPINALTRRRAK